MKPLVYLETTIPSYYCDNRPAVAADIARTREWWDGERDAYDCFISAAVLDELGCEDYPHKEACLKLVETLPLLEVNPEVLEVARVYQLPVARPDAETAIGRRPAFGLGVLLSHGLPADLELPAHCQRQQDEAPRSAQSGHGVGRPSIDNPASTPTVGDVR